jgi:hypothetical protein
MPTAGHGWAATRAASRLLTHPAMNAQELWSGPTHATLERLRTPAVVGRGHETTLLHDGTTPPTAGRGTVTIKPRDEDRLPPPVALTPEHVHGGVLGLQVWPRPAQPVARPRNRKPREAQARSRGRDGNQGACTVKPACPATLGVHMADRAGARQAWRVDVRRRAPGQRAEGIMRATEERRLAPGAAPR